MLRKYTQIISAGIIGALLPWFTWLLYVYLVNRSLLNIQASVSQLDFLDPLVFTFGFCFSVLLFLRMKLFKIDRSFWLLVFSITSSYVYQLLWNHLISNFDLPFGSYWIGIPIYLCILLAIISTIQRVRFENTILSKWKRVIDAHTDTWNLDEILSEVLTILLVTIPMLAVGVGFLVCTNIIAPDLYPTGIGDWQAILLSIEAVVLLYTAFIFTAFKILRVFKMQTNNLRDRIEAILTALVTFYVTVLPLTFVCVWISLRSPILGVIAYIIIQLCILSLGIFIYLRFIRLTPEKREQINLIRKSHRVTDSISYRYSHIDIETAEVYIRDYISILLYLLFGSGIVFLLANTFPNSTVLTELDPGLFGIYLLLLVILGVILKYRWVAVLFVFVFLLDRLLLAFQLHTGGNLVIVLLCTLYFVRGAMGVVKWHSLTKDTRPKKPVWIYVSRIVGGIVVILFAFVLLTVDGQGRDQESKAWVDSTVPELTGSWDANLFVQNASPELLEGTNETVLREEVLKLKTQLGPLNEYIGSNGQSIVDIHNGQKLVFSDYVVSAVFANGPAKIEIKGIKENNKWKILYFYVDLSQIPLETQSTSTSESRAKLP